MRTYPRKRFKNYTKWINVGGIHVPLSLKNSSILSKTVLPLLHQYNSSWQAFLSHCTDSCVPGPTLARPLYRLVCLLARPARLSTCVLLESLAPTQMLWLTSHFTRKKKTLSGRQWGEAERVQDLESDLCDECPSAAVGKLHHLSEPRGSSLRAWPWRV